MTSSATPLLVSLFLLVLSACAEPRPTTSTEGIGQECPAAGCADGQECITSAGLSTCEIRCVDDNDCPDGFRCNLPPVLPGSLPEVCIET